MNKIAITVAPLPQAVYDEISSFPTAEQLAEEICECARAGASVLHLHVIDEEGNATADTSHFEKVIRKVREECDIIVQGSTGGILDFTRDERSVSVEVPEVEMGSLNMGSCNVGDQAYVNTPSDVEYWAEKMKKHNVVPEMNFFEPGMMTMLQRLRDRGLVEEPVVANIALGFPGALPISPDNILFMVRQLPKHAVWTLTPHHVKNFSLHAVSVAMGGNIRVGFEDSMVLSRDEKASSNVELVRKARDLVEHLGHRVATPAETRAKYGIRT